MSASVAVGASERVVSARELLMLAVPSSLFVLLTNGYRVVDQYFVQGVSVAAQAAVGSSIFVLLVAFAGAELIACGVGPLVARATGAGDEDLRRKVIGTGIIAAAFASLIVGAAGVLGAEAIARWLGLEGETARECARYLSALSWTLLPLYLTPVLDYAYLAMGNARTPLILHAISLVSNIILTPIFIFDLGWGVPGAALAANATRGIATAIGLYGLLEATHSKPRDLRLEPLLVPRILRIGAPMAVGTVAYALVYWALLETTISPLGPSVNAGLGVGFSALEGVTWPCYHGVGLATASYVGRYLGAGRPDLARAVVYKALPMTTMLGIIATLAFGLGGSFLTGLFTSDPLVHMEATRYAVVLAWSQILVSWESLEEGVLAGAGATRAVFWGSMPFNVARVPLAYFLAFNAGWGAAGVWWAINVTTLAKVIAKGWVTVRGQWVRIVI